MVLKKKLSPKHKLFAKNLVKHKGNQTDAYLDTYPNTAVTNATSSASRLVANHPEILEQTRQALIKQGVTIDELSKVIKNKLTATKGIVVNNEIEYIPDNNSQLKATELGFKLHGALTNNDNSININVQNNQFALLDKLGDRIGAVMGMFSGLRDEYKGAGKDNKKEEVVDAEYTEGADGKVNKKVES